MCNLEYIFRLCFHRFQVLHFLFLQIGRQDSIFVFLRIFSSQPSGTKLYHKPFFHLGVFHTICQQHFLHTYQWSMWFLTALRLFFDHTWEGIPWQEGFEVWVLAFRNIDLPCHGSVPNKCKSMWSSYYGHCISSRRRPDSYNGCQTSVVDMSHSVTVHHYDQKYYVVCQFCKNKKCKIWNLWKHCLKMYSRLHIF